MQGGIIVGHLDTLSNFFQDENYNFFQKNTNHHVDYPKLKEINFCLGVFAICPAALDYQQNNIYSVLQYIEKTYYLVSRCSELVLIKTYSDIEYILNSDKIGILLALEGGSVIKNLHRLNMLYSLGIRMISLTWNYSNQLANGILGKNIHKGLSDLGYRVVKKMNYLGMIIDVSHLAGNSLKKIINVSSKPVVASHSNVYRICRHIRNLTLQQINIICQKGGLVGINFYPSHLNFTKNECCIEDVFFHIDFIKSYAGINHVGLGTDFDGISSVVRGLEDITALPGLKLYLKRKGYTKIEIKKILQKNWLRIFHKVLRR